MNTGFGRIVVVLTSRIQAFTTNGANDTIISLKLHIVLIDEVRCF